MYSLSRAAVSSFSSGFDCAGLKNRVCSKPRSRAVTNSGACCLPIFGMGSFSKDGGDLLGCKVSVSHWSIDR
jgi:hypothetical protein